MGSCAAPSTKASAAVLGGWNRRAPSLPRPCALPCSQPALSSRYHPEPPLASARGNTAQQAVALALFFLHPRNKMPFGVQCWACWLRSTGVSPVSGQPLAIPPSSHRGAAGSSMGYSLSSTKIISPNVFLTLAKVRGSLERGRAFPKPRKHELLHLQDLPPQPSKTAETSLRCQNEISEQRLPRPKHRVGILVFSLLQNSLIYPKPTSLLPNTSELYWVILNATNGHRV